MHSSILRGSDFHIMQHSPTAGDGVPVAHAEWFEGFQVTDRIGVLAPAGLDGLGASLLLLAFVTAFYDRYRAAGSEFVAYPDFYSFQHREPVVEYRMLDIWPQHKNVYVPADAGATLDAIVDRAITVLLVPAGPLGEPQLDAIQLAGAKRTIRRCFMFAATGVSTDATVSVGCDRPEPAAWARAVLDSALPAGAGNDEPLRAHWRHVLANDRVPEQSYVEVPLATALGRL